MKILKKYFTMLLIATMITSVVPRKEVQTVKASENKNNIDAFVYRPPFVRNPCAEYVVLEDIVLACDIANLKYTAMFLNHSLNEPHNSFPITINRGLDFPSSSELAKKIKGCKEYKTVIKKVKEAIKSKEFKKNFQRKKSIQLRKKSF